MRSVYTAYTLSECMDIMVEYARGREKQGKRTVVFCEDRLTLIAERALAFSSGGTFFTSVSTFARFLQTEKRVLSKQGSVMAVGAVMSALQKEKKLRLFRFTEGIKNAAKSIYETVAQLSASEVDAETLKESAACLEEGVLKDKVSDLALIYDGYRAFLKEKNYLDESGYLSLLPDRIRRSDKMKGASVVFLCYGSFTAQIAEAIRACAETADHVVGIFCAGEEELYTGQAKAIFSRVLKEYGEIETRDMGIPIGGAAEILRRSLFDPEALSTGKIFQTDCIRIFEADDKTAEAETVAANIRKLLAEHSDMRYRDIAVLLADPQGYALAFKKTFAEFGIPYFFDVKKSLRAHPLSRFLLDLFAVVRERFSASSVQAALSNPFFGASDEYRNYLLKYGAYRGGAKREIKTGEPVKDYDVDGLKTAREKLLFATSQIPSKGTGKAFSSAIQRILSYFETERTLERLESEADDSATKSYLAQISAALEKTLDEISLLTDGTEMTVAEFEAVLSGGLEATEISLIPLKSDAVFLGDITDSRIEKARAVFAVGMTDAVPRNADDTALISDQEIGRLDEVKTRIEPTVAEVNLRSRESVALNLCAFTEKLFLSYSLSGNGDEPALSEVFKYLSLFRSKDGQPIKTEKSLPEQDFVYEASSIVPAIRRLILEKFAYEGGLTGSGENYSALYEALERVGERQKDDFLKEADPRLKIERGEELFFGNGRTSPTTLEGYFSCPFCNFAERGLKLKEREETVTLAVDSGNFVHELLERTSQKLDSFASEEEAARYAEETGRELLKKPVYAAQGDTASGKYAAERLLKEGVAAAVAVYRQIVGSSFSVEETEKAVKTDDFYGKVDRVDSGDGFVRVIDYKTGKINDEAAAYYTGRKLQRQLYMSAVMGERTPAGVFYFPASLSFKEKDKGEANFRMSGYLNGEKEAIFAGDNGLKEGETSAFFKARLGDNSRLENVMAEDVFRDFIDYAVLEARQGVKELKSGFIAPSPYDGACDYCKYGGMCGFHRDQAVIRKEESLKPIEIAGIARRFKDGKIAQNGMEDVPVSALNENTDKGGTENA